MKLSDKVIITFIIITLTLVIAFNIREDISHKTNFETKNSLCIQITDELQNKANESARCVDYYCYYAAYAPPEELQETTSTLCICECKLEDGTIESSQVLGLNDQLNFN